MDWSLQFNLQTILKLLVSFRFSLLWPANTITNSSADGSDSATHPGRNLNFRDVTQFRTFHDCRVSMPFYELICIVRMAGTALQIGSGTKEVKEY